MVDVDTLEAGPELDQLVHEGVMRLPLQEVVRKGELVNRSVEVPGGGVRVTTELAEADETVAVYPDPYSDVLELAIYAAEELRKRGWLFVLKLMPDGHPFILEGSRSEYDAPCPDRKVWLRATAEFKWMPSETAEDLQRRLHCDTFAAVRAAENDGLSAAALAICRAAVKAAREELRT